MTNVFTLDDIDNVLNEQYAPTILVVGKNRFEIRQLLRLPRSERDVVQAKLESLNDVPEEELTEDQLRDAMETALSVATANGKGEALIQALDGDILRLKTLFEKWVGSTQAGEASASSS